MSSAPSQVALRARSLIEQKLAEDLPDVRLVTQSPSSANEFYSALVEAAFLVAAADGELSPEEAGTFAETIGYVSGEALAPEEFMELIDTFAAARAQDGVEVRMKAMAASIPDRLARREVLCFAALIALCDHELVAQEEQLITELGKVFGMKPEEVSALVQKVAASLETLTPWEQGFTVGTACKNCVPNVFQCLFPRSID
jgi:tellurite resistance protein